MIRAIVVVTLIATLALSAIGCGSSSSSGVVLAPTLAPTVAPTSAPTLIPTTTPTPIPTSTPTSVVPTPTLTVASSPTPTVAPTASSTPTRTPTSTPTAPPPPLTCVSGTAIGAGSEPVLSLSGGNLVELAYSNGSASASGINFASSSELGKTWSTPVSVVDDGDNNVAPSIATDAVGDAWISWLDVTSGVVKVKRNKRWKDVLAPGHHRQLGSDAGDDAAVRFVGAGSLDRQPVHGYDRKKHGQQSDIDALDGPGIDLERRSYVHRRWLPQYRRWQSE